MLVSFDVQILQDFFNSLCIFCSSLEVNQLSCCQAVSFSSSVLWVSQYILIIFVSCLLTEHPDHNSNWVVPVTEKRDEKIPRAWITQSNNLLISAVPHWREMVQPHLGDPKSTDSFLLLFFLFTISHNGLSSFQQGCKVQPFLSRICNSMLRHVFCFLESSTTKVDLQERVACGTLWICFEVSKPRGQHCRD